MLNKHWDKTDFSTHSIDWVDNFDWFMISQEKGIFLSQRKYEIDDLTIQCVALQYWVIRNSCAEKKTGLSIRLGLYHLPRKIIST